MRYPYSPEEDAIIRALFPVNATREVAKLIERSESSVSQRAQRLGVEKCPKYLATKAHRLNGQEPRSVASRFRRGQEPHNKGRPAAEWNPNFNNCKRTQFRRGELRGAAQHNYVPVGTEKVRDGLLCRKLTDDSNVYPAARWQPVSRIVWETANGPIPPGHAVVFKAGRHTTDKARITPDALEMVSRSELMRRNSRHTRYPEEVNRLIQLKGALNRKINNRSKPREKQNG